MEADEGQNLHQLLKRWPEKVVREGFLEEILLELNLERQAVIIY